MMKRCFYILAVLLVSLSCNPEEKGSKAEDTTGKEEVLIWAKTPDGAVWTRDDEIGIYSTDDFNSRFIVNYLEEGKENRAYFKGSLTPGARILGAYYPYVEAMGDRVDVLSIPIPSEVQYGDAPLRFDIGTYNDAAEIKLTFRRKLANLKLSFLNIDESAVKSLVLTDVTVKGQRNMVGKYAVNLLKPEQMLSGTDASDLLTFHLKDVVLTDDLVLKAAMAATWKGGDVVTVSFNGGEYVTTAVVSNSAEEGGTVELNVNMLDFNPHISLVWMSPDLGTEDGAAAEFRGNVPAVDASGNVYVQLSRGTDKLYKLNAADGTVVWSTSLGYDLDNAASPSCERDGSVIYAAGGSNKTGRIVAVNGSDGSIKWTFNKDQFFANGGTPGPNINCSTPGVGDKNIYVGNAGTTGTVQAIDKITGERVSYVSNAADGTGGPAGGVMSGIAISKGGEVAWFANYGIFTAHQAALDSPSQTGTWGGYTSWAQRISHGWAYNTSRSGVALSSVDGKDSAWAAAMEKTSAGSFNMHIIRSSLDPAASLSYTAKQFDMEYVVNDVTNQDQGGIVIGPRGEAVVSLKGTPGSILGIMPDGTLAYKYEQEGIKDVCGACAVDNNGYIHILFDQPAFYAIVEPDYNTQTCRLVASANLAELAALTPLQIRAWTSVVLGEDGRMYVAVTAHENWSNQRGRVLCLSYTETTGPSSVSPWPQRAADSCHTGVQK